MTEGRIANIMQKTCTVENFNNLQGIRLIPGRCQLLIKHLYAYLLANQLCDGGYLQRMRQSCAHKITVVKREYLCLILQSAKGCTADDPMIVTFNFTAVFSCICGCFLRNPCFACYAIP